MRTSSAFTDVKCPVCNQSRTVSARTARRGATACNECRYPRNVAVEPRHLRYWLNGFSDREIADILSEMMPTPVAPETVAANRAILVASGVLDDTQ